MAVFTTFTRDSLARYLVMFDLGDLVEHQPIETGIENSNYFVTMDAGYGPFDYVLTITESLDFEDIPFFNDLFSLYTRQSLPVPEPQRTLDGMSSTIFCSKPTWLFRRLEGSHPATVDASQCRRIGEALAQLHAAGEGARYSRSNPYASNWVTKTVAETAHRVAPEDRELINNLATEYETLEGRSDLPRGIIHGDLFRDNAFFQDGELTGIIDFYHACEDFLIQDLAIVANDWCVDNGAISPLKREALLNGYEKVRTLEAAEKALLPAFQRTAALRFLLTRLLSGGDGDPLKDPQEFLSLARYLHQPA